MARVIVAAAVLSGALLIGPGGMLAVVVLVGSLRSRAILFPGLLAVLFFVSHVLSVSKYRLVCRGISAVQRCFTSLGLLVVDPAGCEVPAQALSRNLGGAPGALNEQRLGCGIAGDLGGTSDQSDGRIYADYSAHFIRNEAEVETKANPDFQNTPLRDGKGSATVRKKLILAHRQVC